MLAEFNGENFVKFFKSSGYDVSVQSLVREGWMGAVVELQKIRDEYCENLVGRVSQLEDELRKAKMEASHWKGNHDHQVNMSKLLRQRVDLPVERVPVYDDFMRTVEELKQFKEGKYCPRCGEEWADHEFGVPYPECP